MNKVIEVRNLVREYIMGETVIKAVDDISFGVEEGSFVVLLGASGAGKSTVLNILGGMDKPTSGEVFVSGMDIAKFGKARLTKYRRENIGFVFQFYNLMPNLTVIENVELARQICSNPLDAREMLKLVGLSERENNFPSQISGGEQQRVAIARALAKNPDILLCDEPTGALDYKTGKAILGLLVDICRESKKAGDARGQDAPGFAEASAGGTVKSRPFPHSKKTVIVVTHDSAIAPIADMVIRMKSGKIVNIEMNDNPLPVEGLDW